MARDPLFQICVYPLAERTHVVVTMDAGVTGARLKPRTGSFFIDLRAADLVGLTPARSALKVANHLLHAFRAMVLAQERPQAPEPLEGATGEAVQIPGQLPLF